MKKRMLSLLAMALVGAVIFGAGCSSVTNKTTFQYDADGKLVGKSEERQSIYRGGATEVARAVAIDAYAKDPEKFKKGPFDPSDDRRTYNYNYTHRYKRIEQYIDGNSSTENTGVSDDHIMKFQQSPTQKKVAGMYKKL